MFFFTPARKDPISQEFASDVVHIFAAVQNVIGKELNISDEEYPQFLEDLRKGMTEKPDAMWSHGVCLGQKPHWYTFLRENKKNSRK